MIKINLLAVFDVAFRDMMAGPGASHSSGELWQYFEQHLRRAVAVTAAGIDFHLEHMHRVFPELVLDLLSHGPIEKGLDASHGGVEFYNIGIDATGLGNVANAFAAIEQRVERERRLSWGELLHHLDTNWSVEGGERARLMMRSVPGYARGGSLGDAYATRVAQLFTRAVKEQPVPEGRRLIPGLFSWASMFSYGQQVGATPDGRRAGETLTQGANPMPGFRTDGAPTALATAIASVQPGYGNTAPMQIDLEPTIAREGSAVDLVMSLIKGHFDLGGTQINMNILDKQKILEANEDPSRYPDLIVRVTGFSTYFASLSPEFRQMVVDRIIALN
jgi:formate C-acetyltransferase